ncbi:MAG TPA: SIS domain-containing protein [Pirellulales bacterium]
MSQDPAAFAAAQFALRNEISAGFIPPHSEPLARVCQQMAERFRRGGRLLAVGVGPYATDAQHVAVEFVHPVIVGKRALPALDLSMAPAAMLTALAGADDIVMAFAPPEGDAALCDLLDRIGQRGSLVCLWPGRLGGHELPAASSDPFIHQELTELMYHTLWETVHVFFEQQSRGDDVGAAGFLYPFLAESQQGSSTDVLADVAASIREKAREDERLRAMFIEEHAGPMAEAAAAMRERIARGGTVLAFGNGGSATDANDLVFDCLAPPDGLPPVPAISFSAEPANLSAIANDVGVELMFQRQLIANGRPNDVAVAISTSGKSKNLAAALREARKRGLLTLGLSGYDGGDLVREKLVDFAFVVRTDYIPRIQEVQASMYHVLRRMLFAE